MEGLGHFRESDEIAMYLIRGRDRYACFRHEYGCGHSFTKIQSEGSSVLFRVITCMQAHRHRGNHNKEKDVICDMRPANKILSVIR